MYTVSDLTLMGLLNFNYTSERPVKLNFIVSPFRRRPASNAPWASGRENTLEIGLYVMKYLVPKAFRSPAKDFGTSKHVFLI